MKIKKLATYFTMLLFTIFISCKNESLRMYEIESDQSDPTQFLTQPDSIKVLRKMEMIQKVALILLDEYALTVDSPKNNVLKNLLTEVTFWRTEVSGSSNTATMRPFDSEHQSLIRFTIIHAKDLVKIHGSPGYAENVWMLTEMPMKTRTGKTMWVIHVNLEKMLTKDIVFLASGLIHELVHVKHGFCLKRDDEFEAWRIQTDVIKAHLSWYHKWIWNKKVREQKIKPFNIRQLAKDNDEWLRAMFSSPEGYLDKFAFDAYGSKICN